MPSRNGSAPTPPNDLSPDGKLRLGDIDVSLVREGVGGGVIQTG